MNKKTSVFVWGIIGLIFIAIAFVYWFTPAGSLPSFMPGYIQGAADIHVKHGIASLLLGLALLILAWFKSGKRSAQ